MNLFQEAKNILDKDGKVNPLGPYGRSKLTGRETSTYFRRNKVKDANIKKAVEVALDLGGAYDVASKEIKKFYGDKVLRSKEVQQALSYANEEVQEAVSPAQQAAIAISKKEKGEKPKNEDAEAKAKLNLKHTQDMEKLKAKQAREKEAMNEKLDLVLKVRGDKNVKLAQNAMKKFKGISVKRQGGGGITFTGDTNQLHKMQSALAGKIKGLDMTSAHEELSENYRKLAKYGMGTETSRSARVGLELDFYDEKGNKQFGKILQRTNTGYLVQDDKGKKHVLKYHDRKKAKQMLKPNYIHTESTIEEGKLHVSMFTGKDPAGIKVKQVGSDPRGGRDVIMTGPDNKLIAYAVRSLGVDKAIGKKGLKAVQQEIGEMKSEEFDNVDKAKKNPYKALGFSQHPHKGFEGERMPKGMRDFRTKALTPTQIKKQMNVMDSYRAMWEDGEKYAPVDENVERGIMKKMRKGRVAKGMPR